MLRFRLRFKVPMVKSDYIGADESRKHKTDRYKAATPQLSPFIGATTQPLTDRTVQLLGPRDYWPLQIVFMITA